MTSQADMIRAFAEKEYIVPARKNGDKAVAIRAGDVHKKMNLANRMPNVCQALQSKKFTVLTRTTLLSITGPNPGANCIMTFEV